MSYEKTHDLLQETHALIGKIKMKLFSISLKLIASLYISNFLVL